MMDELTGGETGTTVVPTGTEIGRGTVVGVLFRILISLDYEWRV